jgi:hypothetical protein
MTQRHEMLIPCLEAQPVTVGIATTMILDLCIGAGLLDRAEHL